MAPSEEWMNDPERVWPVIVDPDVVVDFTQITDTFVISLKPTYVLNQAEQPSSCFHSCMHRSLSLFLYGRADSTKPNMGLTTWKNAPLGRIRKSDVSIAKNYLRRRYFAGQRQSDSSDWQSLRRE